MYTGKIPQYAIDGLNVVSNNVFASLRETDPWLRIFLKVPMPVRSVMVYPRKACCAERFLNVTVKLEDQAGNKVFRHSNNSLL